MKSIRLLYIAILGMIVGSAECVQQTIFDLPATEAYGLGEQLKIDGMLKCLLVNNHVIKFPIDGHQPTTPEAVEYSCANIDNRPDSPITEWYMKMFGVIDRDGGTSDEDNEYIKAGWSTPAAGGGGVTTQRIISFDASVDGTMVNDPSIPGTQISRLNLFEREFRKIASTSVGRVLLYRILIEIRRKNFNNQHIQEPGIKIMPTVLKDRNINLSIKVKYIRYNMTQDDGEIGFTADAILPTVIHDNTLWHRRLIYPILPQKSMPHVDLFHEFIHWFHALRDFVRSKSESKDIYTNLENINVDVSALSILPSIYYAVQHDYSQERNLLHEIVTSVVTIWGNFEEYRTIMGEIKRDNIEYCEGDDLCENLYRMSLRLPIRYGHCQNGFCEDARIIYYYLNEVFNAFSKYGAIDDSYSFWIDTDKCDLPSNLEKGLGLFVKPIVIAWP